jgi:hypothetical protein
VDPLVSSTVAQSQSLVQNQVAVSMLKKTLDITAEQGAELAKMIAQQSGVGQQVDQYA